MPQIQVFQCPACGANLSYDGGPETSFPCQFCGTAVIVPEELRARAAPSASQPRPISGPSEPVVFINTEMEQAASLQSERAQEMAEVVRLARAGQRSEAIALFRQVAPNTSESAAERAVDMFGGGAGRVGSGGGAGGAGAARAGAMPPAAAAPARRRTSTCSVAGCIVGVLVLAIGISVAGFAALPIGLTGFLTSTLQHNLATEVASAVAPAQDLNDTPTRAFATQGARSTATPRIPLTKTAQAAATQDAQDMATSTAEAATATVADAASATAEALATASAISTTQSAWPQLIADTFVDNRLGWPVGPSQDDYFSLNTTVQGKKYVWAVTPKQGAYANGFPANTTPLTDFSATVKVKFTQGGQDGNTAFGLTFRHTTSEDYGFFGIDPTGHYRIQMSFGGLATEPITGASSAIHKQTGQINQLTVQAVGSDFVFLVNNQVVAQASADADPGEVGLGVDANDTGKLVQVEFTDFSVHAPKQ